MRRKSAILGLAAALALSGAAIGSAHASPLCTSNLHTVAGYTSCTSGDLTFSNFNYSNSSSASNGNYKTVNESSVTVTLASSSDGDGLTFSAPGNSPWEVTSKSKTVNILLSYDVKVSATKVIDDADLHFAGVTKTTEKVRTRNGYKTETVSLGTINDKEKITYTTVDGAKKTTTITADTPSKSVDLTLGLGARSIEVVQDIVLHATQTKDLYVKLSKFTDEFSTMDAPPSTPVPEPGSLGLLGIGLAGLGLLASKRRKRQA